MQIFALQEIVRAAKDRSPFFKDLYRDLNFQDISVEKLPIIDQHHFWTANTPNDNRLMTDALADGIIFKSGGTTGAPKFSAFTRSEWNTFTEIFGDGLVKGGLKPGERIANLFFSGSLYASFLFIYKAIESAGVTTVQLPIAGGTDPTDCLQMLEELGTNTLAGLPTTIMTLAQIYARNPSKFPKLRIDRVLFGGESMYLDQRQLLSEVFPGIRIDSIGYASVDAGLLGFADPSCGTDVHRAFSDASIIEIVDDDTNAPIRKVGITGRVLVTNLTRKLMPILRYPAGDRAQWVDDPSSHNPRFRLVGRAEESARVGPVSIYYSDLQELLSAQMAPGSLLGFQIEVFHQQHRDGMIVRIATDNTSQKNQDLSHKILAALYQHRPMLHDLHTKQQIHPTQIEWVEPTKLTINKRTGKLRRIIDQRSA